MSDSRLVQIACIAGRDRQSSTSLDSRLAAIRDANSPSCLCKRSDAKQECAVLSDVCRAVCLCLWPKPWGETPLSGNRAAHCPLLSQLSIQQCRMNLLVFELPAQQKCCPLSCAGGQLSGGMTHHCAAHCTSLYALVPSGTATNASDESAEDNIARCCPKTGKFLVDLATFAGQQRSAAGASH